MNKVRMWDDKGNEHIAEIVDGVPTMLFDKKYIPKFKGEYCLTDIGGNKFYHLNKIHHRVGGPAVVYSGGERFWILEGRQFDEEQDYWNELEKRGLI